MNFLSEWRRLLEENAAFSTENVLRISEALCRKGCHSKLRSVPDLPFDK